MNDISKRLLSEIQKTGMSYRELSEKTGLPKSAIQRYAVGETDKIPIDRLELIARALGTSTAYLMGWESEPSATPLPIMEENKSFGERLREKRKENNLTQKQLAEIIGVAKSTVAGYESGHSEPDMEKIVKIMGALDVDANYLWQDAMKYKSYDDYISSDALEIAKQYDHLEPDGKQFIQMAMKFAQRPSQKASIEDEESWISQKDREEYDEVMKLAEDALKKAHPKGRAMNQK